MIGSTLNVLIPTTALTTSPVKLYTAIPGAGIVNAKAQVTSIVITNIDSAQHNIFIYNVPFGGSAVNGNLVFGGNPIPALTTWIETVGGDGVEVWTLVAGGEIWAKADVANVLNLTISGREHTG